MIADNFDFLKQQIIKTCAKCGRNPQEIDIVAVSKYSNVSQIQRAYEGGCRNFGENRLQEALPKIEAMPKDCMWHFMGRIQSNKISKIIEKFYLIHSVPNYQTAELISKSAQKIEKYPSILLQVNTSNEESKSGDTVETWRQHLTQVFRLPNLKVCGLMTMAPLTDDEDLIRKTFSVLARFLKEIQKNYPEFEAFKILSMGMSNDYSLAIEEGSTLLRIGSAIFHT